MRYIGSVFGKHRVLMFVKFLVGMVIAEKTEKIFLIADARHTLCPITMELDGGFQ